MSKYTLALFITLLGCGDTYIIQVEPTPITIINEYGETATEIDRCHVTLKIIRLLDGTLATGTLTHRTEVLGWDCWLTHIEDRPIQFPTIEITSSTWEHYMCYVEGREGCALT